MADQASEDLLRLWGIAYGEPGLAWEHRRRISEMVYHPIAEGMTFAPGKRPIRVTRILGRDGRVRRRVMGAAAGLMSANGTPLPVPAGFVDPIPAPSKRRYCQHATERPVPPELQRVERAVHALEEFNLLRAICLRANYCMKGDQAEKLDWATARMRQISKHAEPLKLKRFRDELVHARVFVVGFLAGMERAA